MPDYPSRETSDQGGQPGCLTLVQWGLNIFLGIVFLRGAFKSGGFIPLVFGGVALWIINSFFNNLKKSSGEKDIMQATFTRQALPGADNPMARGLELQKGGNYFDALKAFNQALGQDPQNAEAWLHKGQVLKALEREDEASEAFFKYYDLSGQIKPDKQ